MKLTDDQWDEMSSMMLRITREFNVMADWQGYTTSYWRMNSDDALREILEKLDEYAGLSSNQARKPCAEK
jgi:hypothetical protein